MKLVDRVQLWISYLLRVSLLLAVVAMAFRAQWLNLFLTFFTLLLTFLPGIIQRNYRVYLPIELELTMIFFIYAALYLGEIHGFYARLWWWDGVLHGLSAIVLGFTGFLIVYILNSEKKIKIHMGPKFVALFSFTFALAIGALWEICEFFMDQTFGFNMQKSGIRDTMWDLILDATGAFLVALSGYFYLKTGKAFFFNRILRKFIEKNPKFF